MEQNFRCPMDRLYLAYLEEKCHVHPTAKVEFVDDTDYDCGTVQRVIIGGFDCGISIMAADVLNWMIEQDIKPSEAMKY